MNGVGRAFSLHVKAVVIIRYVPLIAFVLSVVVLIILRVAVCCCCYLRFPVVVIDMQGLYYCENKNKDMWKTQSDLLTMMKWRRRERYE
jgi:hypothetical protein